MADGNVMSPDRKTRQDTDSCGPLREQLTARENQVNELLKEKTHSQVSRGCLDADMLASQMPVLAQCSTSITDTDKSCAVKHQKCGVAAHAPIRHPGRVTVCLSHVTTCKQGHAKENQELQASLKTAQQRLTAAQGELKTLKASSTMSTDATAAKAAEAQAELVSLKGKLKDAEQKLTTQHTECQSSEVQHMAPAVL